jgi:hypothetical protein
MRKRLFLRSLVLIEMAIVGSACLMSITSGERQIGSSPSDTANRLLTSSGLELSAPKNGLALAISGKTRIPAEEFGETFFNVFVVNVAERTIAVNRHRGLLWLALYDSKGVQLSDPQRDLACLAGPAMRNVAVLDPNEIIGVRRLPYGLGLRTPGKGRYVLRAILETPSDDSWPDGCLSLLRRDNVVIWRSNRLISSEHRIVLE